MATRGGARSPAARVRPRGTAEPLTLFHPADEELRCKGVTGCTDRVLHPWLKEELAAVLESLPEPGVALSPEQDRALWESRQEGLTEKVTLLAELPPLRVLLAQGNLAGHKTPEPVVGLFEHGVMPLYTPLGGSQLNMAESVQRIPARRGLEGQHPTRAQQVIEWLEAVARAWNRGPTPFEWGGKRKARRERAWQRRYALAGSAAHTRRSLRPRRARPNERLCA